MLRIGVLRAISFEFFMCIAEDVLNWVHQKIVLLFDFNRPMFFFARNVVRNNICYVWLMWSPLPYNHNFNLRSLSLFSSFLSNSFWLLGSFPLFLPELCWRISTWITHCWPAIHHVHIECIIFHWSSYFSYCSESVTFPIKFHQ